MNRPARVALVTTGLVGVGALFGAVAGTIAVAISLTIDGLQSLIAAAYLGALFGAPLGGIAAPILGWSLLRRVPLGKMFVGCAAGTIIGGVIGFMLSTSLGDIMIGGLGGALLGCLGLAVILRSSSRPAQLT
jgi:hypothetical protein